MKCKDIFLRILKAVYLNWKNVLQQCSDGQTQSPDVAGGLNAMPAKASLFRVWHSLFDQIVARENQIKTLSGPQTIIAFNLKEYFFKYKEQMSFTLLQWQNQTS